MRRIMKAFILVVDMSSEATAYNPYPITEDEWTRMRQVLEIQGIEQNARYRQMEIDDRLMQLERQDRTEQRDKEGRHRQLEGKRYRSEWR